ncbi:MAG: sodium:solute symporter [Muribaculum sp.]|nr:sodium:solute symporter [Muribaculum sp.]
MVIISIAVYFAIFFGVSYLSSRRTDNAAFFNADRRVPWPIVAIATIGAPISGVTFISVPGMVLTKGHSYLQMGLGFIVGYLAIAFILVPLFYRRNLISIYGYLGERFGLGTYITGAWFFFISKMLGAAVRFFVVCVVLQVLVFGPLGVPFALNVVVSVGLIWACTARGGVKSIIWTDVVKTICLVATVVMCIYFISDAMGWTASKMIESVNNHPTSRVFNFDNPSEPSYFWKQFLAGIFMVVAMTGLDQDMMQRNLACRDVKQCRKNMITSSVMQTLVIMLFLMLGTMMAIYLEANPQLTRPEKSDELFSRIATGAGLPLVVGIMFVVGLVAVSYSATASALVSLTTSFTVDILGHKDLADTRLQHRRRGVHFAMAVCMVLIIVLFYHITSEDAISTVYVLASYTYGPILGLFMFGLVSTRRPSDVFVPIVCIAAPVVCWFLKEWLATGLGYHMSFELLIVNALLTMAGLYGVTLVSKPIFETE